MGKKLEVIVFSGVIIVKVNIKVKMVFLFKLVLMKNVVKIMVIGKWWIVILIVRLWWWFIGKFFKKVWI